MVEFNPFDKQLEDVDFEDLLTLRENNFAEGYFVEYKSDIPGDEPGKSIAKVIASFANTYGGWLFLGIPEEFNNEAGEPTGIDLSDHPQPKETVQQWVQTRVHPIPYFESHLVQLLDNEKKAVQIVRVPESWETPHLMNDGVTYRRTGERSNPIEPETDRWVLDRLHQRRSDREQKRTRVLQHLRQIKSEIKMNEDIAWGNRRVIRHLQDGKQRDEVDHYLLELLSTDAWDASLDAQLLDVISGELYQQVNEFYYSVKSTNEAIKRTRNEYLHPKVGQDKGGRFGGKIWTISVNFWDPDDEEVDYYGLGSLIWSLLSSIDSEFSNLEGMVQDEIDRLDSQISREDLVNYADSS